MTLQEMAEKIIEAWTPIAEQIEKLREALRKAIDEANKKIEEHKRLLCRSPKWYSKANNPSMIVRRIKLYHCRNNC